MFHGRFVEQAGDVGGVSAPECVVGGKLERVSNLWPYETYA